MIKIARRWITFLFLAIIVLFTLYNSLTSYRLWDQPTVPRLAQSTSAHLPDFISWKDVPIRHPVESMIALPTGPPASIPPIQHVFEPETNLQRLEREERLAAVKRSFVHSWEGYKRYAWLQDEVAPVTCLLYTSPSPRDGLLSRMPSSA